MDGSSGKKGEGCINIYSWRQDLCAELGVKICGVELDATFLSAVIIAKSTAPQLPRKNRAWSLDATTQGAETCYLGTTNRGADHLGLKMGVGRVDALGS